MGSVYRVSTNSEGGTQWTSSGPKTAKSLQNAIGRLGSWGGVNPNDYLSGSGDNLVFDYSGYRQAAGTTRSTSPAYYGWTEQDYADFEAATRGYTSRARSAAQVYFGNQVAQRNANERSEQQRADMLAEIEAYKAGFSNEHIAQAVSAERQAWDLKISETMNQAVQQAAAQGRVMDNTTYAMLRGRLEAQAANVIQKTQMDYEAKRQEYMFNALQAKNSVYGNSGATVMSGQEVASLIAAMAGK